MIVPSLLAPTYEEIKNVADKLRGHVSEIQIDIADGKFVPTATWPFTVEGSLHGELDKFSELAEGFELEVDCMVIAPEQYLDDLVSVGVSRLVIHSGSTNNWETIWSHKQKHGYKLGLGIMNGADLESVSDLVAQSDYVQVMGINEIGKQGQPFSEATIKTIVDLKNNWLDLPVAVDGAVNEETIVRLKDAGAERFAPGSAISRAADPVGAYNTLVNLVG